MSEFKELHGAEGLKKIGSLIPDHRIVMLVTTAGDGSLESRPMAIHVKDFDGVVWFLTPKDSGKVHEIRNAPYPLRSAQREVRLRKRAMHTPLRTAEKSTSFGTPCTKLGFRPAKTIQT